MILSCMLAGRNGHFKLTTSLGYAPGEAFNEKQGKKIMNRSMVWAAILLSGAGMAALVPTIAAAQSPLYSEQFSNQTSYKTGSSQYDNWLSFRASLPASGVTSITVNGSLDPVGRTCSDPASAQQIADAMRAGAAGIPNTNITLSLSCGGFTWNTGSCSNQTLDANNLTLTVGPGALMCRCSTTHHTLRPGITGGSSNSSNWGGVASFTCDAPSQTMTVAVNLAPTVIEVGIDIHPGSYPNSINLDSGGTTPIAILGDGVLDLNDIDVTTLTVGTLGVKTVGKTDKSLCSVQDVSGPPPGPGGAEDPSGEPDGIDDLVCHFITVGIVTEDGDTTARLWGDFLSSGSLEGTDSVNIVP